MILLFVEALNRSPIVDDRNNDVPVVCNRLLFDHDVIAVVDTRLNHAFPMHRQHERRCIANDFDRQRHSVGDVLLGKDGDSSRNVPDQWHGHDIVKLSVNDIRSIFGMVKRVGKRYRPRFQRIALDKALLLKRLQMNMHGGRRGEPQSLTHLANSGTKAFFADVLLDDVEHRLLALSDLVGHGLSFRGEL